MKRISILLTLKILVTLISVFFIQFLSAQTWTQVTGIQAQDIAVGKNGSVWAIGTNSSIYRLNGSSWETIPGGAVRIAVDPEGAAWVVNTGGDIYKYNLTIRNWELKQGKAKDIGIGADGSVWVIGGNAVPGGYDIYKWNGSGWNKIPGGAIRIAVEPSGNAWVVNNSNNVFRFNGSAFEMKPGAVQDIGIGADGTIWCTGKDNGIYKWMSTNWQQQSGGATQISVGPDGNAWVANAAGHVYKSTSQTSTTSTVATTNTSNTNIITASQVSTVSIKPTSGEVEFENIGRLPVAVYSSSADKLIDKITEIRPQSTVKIKTKIGDEFEVLVIEKGEEKEGYQPKIYITDVQDRIYLYGNIPMYEFEGYGLSFKSPDYSLNLVGIDATKLNYENLVASINKRQIFESLDEVSGTDYTTIAGKLMKFGFEYSATNLRQGEFKSHMSYGYNSFSNGWNLSLSGKAPVKGVDVGGDFAYSESQSETQSSMNIFAYTREQASKYIVTLDRYKAKLSSEFKQAVRTVKTPLDVQKKIIDIYGTHFATAINYGGERAAYLRMTSEEYTKAKSMSLNIKAEVTTATKSVKTDGMDKNFNTTTTKEDKGGSGGSLGFGYTQNNEQKSLLENTKSQYRMIGGNGDFQSWSISEDDAAPIAVSVEKIYELIDPKCFKDNTRPEILAEKKALIKQVVEDYLQKNMPQGQTAGIKTPAPKVYEVVLTKMEVIEEVDDANKNTKGSISVIGYDDKKAQLKNQGGNLWQQDGYSTDFEFRKGKAVFPNAKKYFTQFPQSGGFKSFYIRLNGEIIEKDDLWDIGTGDWSYGAMRGNTDFIDLEGLKLEPGVPVTKNFEVSFHYTAANLGKVRLTYTIMLMPSEFDMQLF